LWHVDEVEKNICRWHIGDTCICGNIGEVVDNISRWLIGYVCGERIWIGKVVENISR
jgi:hypothetical protein